MTFTYRTKGVCSQQMDLEINGTTIESLLVTGGCNGNLKGISKLVAGMEIDDVINRLEGVTCGFKPTSCPDQLAQALKAYKAQNNL